MRREVDTIIKNANEILTLSGGLKVRKFSGYLNIIKKGSIAIENGKIADVGSTNKILKKI